MFVALDADHDVIGTSAFDPDDNAIISMWVAADQRGTGVGRALLNAAVAQAEGAMVSLRVMADNRAAIGFYERCGFVLMAREPDAEGTLAMTGPV